MNVYLVFKNDQLLGVYGAGSRAEARLRVAMRGLGRWKRSESFNDKADPYVQRWWQEEGPVARLAVEKEEVQ